MSEAFFTSERMRGLYLEGKATAPGPAPTPPSQVPPPSPTLDSRSLEHWISIPRQAVNVYTQALDEDAVKGLKTGTDR